MSTEALRHKAEVERARARALADKFDGLPTGDPAAALERLRAESWGGLVKEHQYPVPAWLRLELIKDDRAPDFVEVPDDEQGRAVLELAAAVDEVQRRRLRLKWFTDLGAKHDALSLIFSLLSLHSMLLQLEGEARTNDLRERIQNRLDRIPELAESAFITAESMLDSEAGIARNASRTMTALVSPKAAKDEYDSLRAWTCVSHGENPKDHGVKTARENLLRIPGLLRALDELCRDVIEVNSG